jgi:hypothetical protein
MSEAIEFAAVLPRPVRRDGEPARCAVCGRVATPRRFGAALCGRHGVRLMTRRDGDGDPDDVSRQARWAAGRRAQERSEG